MRPLLPALLLAATSLCAADFPQPYDSEKLPGGPLPAEEVARTMELPPGFTCTVFASEPDVRQPIAMAWDARGRLWIAENYTFAENPRRWDTTLRDRIVIFEDKDNDGRHDGRKVFWEGGSYLTSVELGYDGVWLLNDGKLAFLADKNHDDLPDNPEPEVLLDGFDTQTIGHNIVNGLRWGPDGWLYGRHGITSTSSVGAPGTPAKQRIKMNCAIWRYHPTRKMLEVVCHGGTNSWGHDWDANGELFYINTVINHLWHVIPGAYYDRMFGTHLNPHVYETISPTADHYHWDTGAEKWSDIRQSGVTSKTDALGGGHAHVGMMIYNGGLWPKEYQGAAFTCNLHGNRINMDTLHRQGCGFVAKHGKDFMKTKDKWFRGIDLSTGPDGNVFVLDWSDTGECHDNDGVHRSSGRIYKIVYGEGKRVTLDLSRLAAVSSVEAGKALLPDLVSPNSWQRNMAQRVLIDAGLGQKEQREISDFLAAAANRINQSSQQKDAYPLTQRNSLWHAAHSLGASLSSGFEDEHSEEAERVLSLDRQVSKTFVEQQGMNSLTSTAILKSYRARKEQIARNRGYEFSEPRDRHLCVDMVFAAEDPSSGLVRLHLASALQRLPLDARFPIATALASHAEDATDRQQPLMIWYGIEPAVAADPMKGVALVEAAKLPTVRRLVTRRIVEDFEKNRAAVDALVALATRSEEARPDILAGMAAALKGISQAPKPQGWDELSRTGVPPVTGAKGVSPDPSRTGVPPVTGAKGVPPVASNTPSQASAGKMPSAPVTGGTPVLPVTGGTPVPLLLTELNLVFGSGRALDDLIALIKTPDADASARRSALDSLLRNPKPEHFDIVRAQITDKVLGTAARLGLAKFDGDRVAKALLNTWPDKNTEHAAANIATLVSRASSAAALLAAIEQGKLPRTVLSPFQARQIASLNDPAVSATLAKVWGEVRDTPEAKQQELAKWKATLTPETLAKADLTKGQAVFAGLCAACHKLYGQGGSIAPDLTGGNRHDLSYLLENLIDPSAIVPADYRITVLKLKDGRTLTGVIPEQSERTLTLQSQVERVVIEKAQIETQQQLPASLMPEGQLSALSPEQARDLIAYIMSHR